LIIVIIGPAALLGRCAAMEIAAALGYHRRRSRRGRTPMSRHRWESSGKLAWFVGLLLGVGGFHPTLAETAPRDFAFFHENVLGTSCELRVRADSEEAARRAEQRVLEEVDRLAAIFSSYDPTSEFTRWQATSGVPTRLSPELFEILQASDDWHTRSGGAFDPRVQVLSRLWSECARTDRRPTAEETTAALALMSAPAWRLDPAAGTAEHLSVCPLSLNAIAKGAIVERATAAALTPAYGVHGLLLNIGGDLRVCGAMTPTIGIARPWGDSETTEPLARIEVQGRSVATSGNSQRGFDIQGRHYSHILDPRSGNPADRTVAATVIATRGADADALATIFNVLPIAESLRLADALPDVACLLVSDDGQIARNDRWRAFEKPRPEAVAVALAGARQADAPDDPAATSRPAWNPEFELVVQFEINRPDGDNRRFRRPYVAVWIEDQEGHAVRTLSLWVQAGGPGPRWIHELKRWYRGEQARRLVDDINLVDTIARPTRLPGNYQVVWDGKDDLRQQRGAGEYTVLIEAAREHGTYQLIRKTVTLADQPIAEELKGNVEIKSASIAYRRKTVPK
jgi:thiamine biosynthesis lipoprotein ApbE